MPLQSSPETEAGEATRLSHPPLTVTKEHPLNHLHPVPDTPAVEPSRASKRLDTACTLASAVLAAILWRHTPMPVNILVAVGLFVTLGNFGKILGDRIDGDTDPMGWWLVEYVGMPGSVTAFAFFFGASAMEAFFRVVSVLAS